ncbi:MAG: Phenylacetic acid catabolic protein, partial [Burkholderiales bacterium]
MGSDTSTSAPSASQVGSTTLPVEYLLHLADNALVLGQRNAEWSGHGPILEEDIALSNNSLD